MDTGAPPSVLLTFTNTSTGQSLVVGALLGAIGGVIGAFLGYGIRRRLDLHIKDLVVAICEDIVAVGLALFFVSR